MEAAKGDTAAVESAIRAEGGRVTSSFDNLVQADIPVPSLPGLAANAAVRVVRPPLPMKLDAVSEGVGLVGADTWHNSGFNGAGVKIGIVDEGFAGYSSKLGIDLPPSVNTTCSQVSPENGEAHGTAVAEIVYDMAPGAQLYLAAENSDVDFGNAVNCLAAQGVQVINHSSGWMYSGPGDGTGLIDNIVNSAVNQGVFWANSAGNSRQRHWAGGWADANGNGWLDFTSGSELQAITAVAGQPIVVGIRWNDTWGASCNDYDLYLFDSALNPVAISNNSQTCISDPREWIEYKALYSGTYYIAVGRYQASGASFFDLISFYNDLRYQVAADSLLQPADNGSPNFAAVGAVNWQTPTTQEFFSSEGPTTDGRIKPDIAAPDGVSTATYGTNGFLGTSASSPHVAGAAALIKQAHPSFGAGEIKSFLKGLATDLGPAGMDNQFGSGLLRLGPAFYPYTAHLPSTVQKNVPR